MQECGYSKSHIEGHQRIYLSLKNYCQSISKETYTRELGETFLHVFDRRRPTKSPNLLRFYKTAIRRLNDALDDVEWQPERKSDKVYASSCFDAIVYAYEQYLYRTGKTKKHVRIHVHVVARFLQSVEGRGCTKLRELSATDIFETFQQATDKNMFHLAVAAFLRYADIYEMILKPLDLIVPAVKRHKPVPTVYSPEEVEQLLASADRTTRTGKRDYAIMLIAARLGLRASDIAGLTFDNLRFAQSSIVLTQVKTKMPLVLPLMPEVRAAIDDYTDNARPKTTDRYVFQKVHGIGKISPDGVGAIVHNGFVRSGIACKKRKTGAHALQSSLATALLAEGNDYPTIQRTLGHKDVQTVMHYAVADIEPLRLCALPVPLPEGNFAALLRAGDSGA